MRLAVVFAMLLMLAACTGRGVAIGGDGIRDNTPEYARAYVAGNIARDLDGQLSPHARAEVVIAELPQWRSAARGRSEGWYWDQATVQIDLVGDAGALPVLSKSAAQTVVTKRLRPSLTAGDASLLLRVSALEDGRRFARLARTAPLATPPTPGPAATVATRGPRRYRVQRGDTLAEISTVFYGSPEHWRRIVDANPSLDPAQLRAGDELTIP